MTHIAFVDVNVFMYAAGASHSLKAPCVKILSDIETGALSAATNTEVLQELLYRYSHIGLPGKGTQLCRDILQYPLTILPVTEADVRLAIRLFDSYCNTGLRPRDAIHAATMQNHSISHLVSADKDFDKLPFITRIDPLSYL